MKDPKELYVRTPMGTMTSRGAQMVANPATGMLEDRSQDILGAAFGGIGGRAIMKAAKTATKKALEQFTYTDNTVSSVGKLNKSGNVYTPNRGIKPDNVRKPVGPPVKPNQREITKKIVKNRLMDYGEYQGKAMVGNITDIGLQKAVDKLK